MTAETSEDSIRTRHQSQDSQGHQSQDSQGHRQSSASNFPSRFTLGEPLFEYGRIAMEWFSKRTSIAGIQLPNWMVVLGAIIVILIIYTSIH
jgi:hypothetical protein